MNKLHVYTGPGKGKTTAAMGLALRSIGHGWQVLAGQFMKDGTSGELAALRRLGAQVCPSAPVEGFVGGMSAEEKARTARAQEAYAQSLAAQIRALRPQLILLDELGVAVELDMVRRETAQQLVNTALEHGETVVTGYFMPPWLLDRADYITRMEAVRHPFQTQGLAAREGVEW